VGSGWCLTCLVPKGSYTPMHNTHKSSRQLVGIEGSSADNVRWTSSTTNRNGLRSDGARQQKSSKALGKIRVPRSAVRTMYLASKKRSLRHGHARPSHARPSHDPLTLTLTLAIALVHTRLILGHCAPLSCRSCTRNRVRARNAS
jgi:hypothetical protein